MRLIICVIMCLASCVVAGEQLDFTMRDKDGKKVEWSIKYEDECGKKVEKLPMLFTGPESIMQKFGLKEVPMLPMCGETVNFFVDKGEINGQTYTMEGAEYVGPWGARCVYAKSNATPDIEMALHLWGKFRYWTSSYTTASKMQRKEYAQEDVGAKEGDRVLDGKKFIAAREALKANGMSEDEAINKAMADSANFKTTAPWGAGTLIETVNLPLPKGLILERITSKSGEKMYVTKRYTTTKARETETRYIQRSMLEQRLKSTQEEQSNACANRINRAELTADALRKAGLMKQEENLVKVLFAEEVKVVKTTDTNEVFLQDMPLIPIITSRDVVRTFVTMTTYPLDVQ